MRGVRDEIKGKYVLKEEKLSPLQKNRKKCEKWDNLGEDLRHDL